MKKAVMNLYVKKDCPKCDKLIKLCKEREIDKYTDFKVVEIDLSDKTDTDVQLLDEAGIKSLPALLAGDMFFVGSAAEFYITEILPNYKKLYEKDAMKVN